MGVDRGAPSETASGQPACGSRSGPGRSEQLPPPHVAAAACTWESRALLCRLQAHVWEGSAPRSGQSGGGGDGAGTRAEAAQAPPEDAVSWAGLPLTRGLESWGREASSCLVRFVLRHLWLPGRLRSVTLTVVLLHV